MSSQLEFLKPYGYQPGTDEGRPCQDCKKPMLKVGRQAIRCIECACEAYETATRR